MGEETAARRGRAGNEVVVILWRDIPVQVNGQRGRERSQLLLSDKFQRAVDRAKRKAGIYTANEDIAQWQRISATVDGDPFAAAEARAAELEREYSKAYLGRLAYSGGLVADMHGQHIDSATLAALEELDDDAADDDAAGASQ